MTIHGNAMQYNTMLRHATRRRTEVNSIEQNIDLNHIKYNAIQYNTILYRTVQHNTTLCNLPNTDYRIASHRTIPRHTTADCSNYHSSLLHGEQRSSASPLNMHLLTLADALAPALGLSLTPVIRTSCSNHNGTRSILASPSFSFIPYHTIPHHTSISFA